MKAAILFGAVALLTAGATSAADIKVAADVGYSPHVMASASGGVEGYNVDIMDEIAKRMSVKHEVIDQEWSGIFAGLAAGKYVVIIAPTTVTKERSEKMLFGEPYFEVNYQFLIKKGASRDKAPPFIISRRKVHRVHLFLPPVKKVHRVRRPSVHC